MYGQRGTGDHGYGPAALLHVPPGQTQPHTARRRPLLFLLRQPRHPGWESPRLQIQAILPAILSDALGACCFHRNRSTQTTEAVSLERIDHLDFYY
ncbi:hypothetical protein ABTZ93_35985 [Streptomyces sp. NPDC097941]|uniref:hypothetical protein n=1 Tax=Streptomyces sp. NPDC097941 TaxID=3155685 RepID=UPI0033211A02